MKLQSLRELLIEELSDAYDAEKQILEALPKMAQATQTGAVRKAFEDHERQTREQVSMLDRCFEMLEAEPTGRPCKGMKGIIAEGQEMLKQRGDQATIEAGLIASAQKVEHYEIATYGTCRTYAERLGNQDAADLIQQVLDQEKAADVTLTRVAESSVNVEAAVHAGVSD